MMSLAQSVLNLYGCYHVTMERLPRLDAGVPEGEQSDLYNIYFQKQYVNRAFHFIVGGLNSIGLCISIRFLLPFPFSMLILLGLAHLSV